MSYRDAIDHGETNVGLGMVPGATEGDRLEQEIDRLRTQLDQERQRREQAEGLLRKCLQACDVHQRLDGCDKCGFLLDRIDKHFGEWDE